jgi:hypothetical protein
MRSFSQRSIRSQAQKSTSEILSGTAASAAAGTVYRPPAAPPPPPGESCDLLPNPLILLLRFVVDWMLRDWGMDGHPVPAGIRAAVAAELGAGALGVGGRSLR